MLNKLLIKSISYQLSASKHPSQSDTTSMRLLSKLLNDALDLPFEDRALLAQQMIFEHGVSSGETARLLHSIPSKHSVSGNTIIYLVTSLLSHKVDRRFHEDICADLIRGYDNTARHNLFEIIFKPNVLILEKSNSPWIPGHNLSRALADHIASTDVGELNYQIMDIFMRKDILFRAEILERYVERFDIHQNSEFVKDLLIHGRLVSDQQYDDGEGVSYLDVFISHIHKDTLVNIIEKDMHLTADINNRAGIIASNIIARMGGNDFLEHYFSDLSERKLKVALTLATREQHIASYPALKNLILTQWRNLLTDSVFDRVHLTIKEKSDFFTNIAKMLCSEDKRNALPLINIALEHCGFYGEQALDDYFSEIRENESTAYLTTSVIKGIGPQIMAEIVNFEGSKSRLPLTLFPDHSTRELAKIFPKFRRHAVESDLGI